MPMVLKIINTTNHGTESFLAARHKAKAFQTVSQIAKTKNNQTQPPE